MQTSCALDRQLTYQVQRLKNSRATDLLVNDVIINHQPTDIISERARPGDVIDQLAYTIGIYFDGRQASSIKIQTGSCFIANRD